jgi:hypothetical protein
MRIARLPLVALLLVATGSPVVGQDSTDPAARRDQLRQLIEQRFTERAQQELKLTEEQTSKLRETNRKFGGKRRELEARQMAIRNAMSDQLRPGVAANRDSLSRLTDAAAEIRVQYAQTFREELRETSKYLDPVQRAQLLTMRERLLRRIREVRSGRGRHEDGGREGYRYRRRTPERDSVGAPH